MRSIKKKIAPVEGPTRRDFDARIAVAPLDKPVRKMRKRGPRKESTAGPVKTASRKTNPKPPDGEC